MTASLSVGAGTIRGFLRLLPWGPGVHWGPPQAWVAEHPFEARKLLAASCYVAMAEPSGAQLDKPDPGRGACQLVHVQTISIFFWNGVMKP